KDNYPQTIRDNEVKWDELKNALGLPVDEKVNGYGLNFVGRNVANAKYKQKTAKELRVNTTLSNDFDNAQNMILKGDNLDSLKILKSHYNGRIKCIYIDPPYNTKSDEFIYPDKFDKEEAEVLGLANVSETDFDRMQFSFSSKKSHSGWLAFMYPRLMLAYDLLAKDGVIFISIDDNEQANLKLLCDEIFGEDNFAAQFPWRKRTAKSDVPFGVSQDYEWILCYAKSDAFTAGVKGGTRKYFETPDFPGRPWRIHDLTKQTSADERPNSFFTITDPKNGIKYPANPNRTWAITEETFDKYYADKRIVFPEDYDFLGISKPAFRYFQDDDMEKLGEQFGYMQLSTFLPKDVGMSQDGTKDFDKLFKSKIFGFPKPVSLIKHLINAINHFDKNAVILDFFAGSGTTAQAVMELNAEDGGNRSFILCQKDEEIDDKKKSEAYDFCINNCLPPVISSITIERIKRAGEKILSSSSNLFNGGALDLGFKVFDLADAPKLEVVDGQIVMQNTETDSFSRIYNMIFSVGIDNPIAKPECVLEGCMYKIVDNYYITNAEELDKAENKHFLVEAIQNGKVYIDGWTASINITLQNYKEDVKIVF
ncbi:MAG: site-specific DNA-methyltransferase, partial [Bacteroidales bacterium]|nr:site-specific DNA-methyltransferase [Bacteroidales bacterium]